MIKNKILHIKIIFEIYLKLKIYLTVILRNDFSLKSVFEIN